MSVKKIDFEESTMVTTGEANSVTEISYEKTTRKTLRYMVSGACGIL